MSALAEALAPEQEGSSFHVKVERIRAISVHPKADRLELATVLGWQTVIPKGEYNVGDLVVYIPIDSILPIEVESALFGPDSKVKLSKSRVKTIKLRGAISQGMVCKPEVLGITKYKEGLELTEKLGITKYQPPAPKFQSATSKAGGKLQTNPNFHKYGGIENFKNYPELFKEGEQVYVTEKIHGTHFRAGYVKTSANTFFKRIKKIFGLLPEYEFVYGSNNVQLQDKWLYSGFYDKNVYAEAVIAYSLREKLKPGEVVHGEIYGAGIQKDYLYGCSGEERKLVLFDLKREGKYVSPDEFINFCTENAFSRAPELYRGPYSETVIRELVQGPSVLAPSQKIREGVVIRPVVEEQSFMGRKLLKLINDDYLMTDPTEFH